MNETRRVEMFLAKLSESYGRKLGTATIELQAMVIGSALAGVDLNELAVRIMRSEKFYPLPAVVLEYAGYEKESDDRELAKQFVDKAVFYFQQKPQQAYGLLTSHGYSLAKHIGMDPFGLKTGNQDPSDFRYEWIANLERVIEAEPGWRDFLQNPPPEPKPTLAAPPKPEMPPEKLEANRKRLAELAEKTVQNLGDPSGIRP